jgi:hypothetical protein
MTEGRQRGKVTVRERVRVRERMRLRWTYHYKCSLLGIILDDCIHGRIEDGACASEDAEEEPGEESRVTVSILHLDVV